MKEKFIPIDIVFEQKKMGLRVFRGHVWGEKEMYNDILIEKPLGVYILPYVRKENGEILIGMIKNNWRLKPEEFIDEIPRGYGKVNKIFKERPLGAARREFAEEDEANVKLNKKRFAFLGGPYIMDSSWFKTPGDYIFACEIKENEIIVDSNGKQTISRDLTNDFKMSRLEFINLDTIDFKRCGMSKLSLMLFKEKLK